ncbi:S-adenosyl-L-methionine-dependent methyltransferase [Aspergillus crustosus]
MSEEAETVFNTVGASYEAAFGTDEELRKYTELAAKTLPPRSRVLDVGCGTGKPVSDILATAGHEVHGIDISNEMVTIAGSQVLGNFHVADMRAYHPLGLFHAVFAIRSLFQMPACDMCSIVVRFSQWIRVGGYLILGVTPSTSLDPHKVTYDTTWDCAWMLDKIWMGNYVNDLFLSEERWLQLLRESGFVLEMKPVSYLFSPAGDGHSPEAHYLLMAKKVEREPLIGPYPLSACLKSPHFKCAENLVSEDLGRLLGDIDDNDKVLCVGKELSRGPFERHAARFVDCATLLEDLPFAPASFNTAIAVWQLDYVPDLEQAIQQLISAVGRENSKVVLVQGAPYNEVIRLLTCVARSSPVHHQGHLLHVATRLLAKHGFGNISVHRIDAGYEFRGESVAQRSTAAAEFLAGIWNKEHPQHDEIQRALVARLQLLFRGDAHTVSNGMVAIVARPSVSN